MSRREDMKKPLEELLQDGLEAITQKQTVREYLAEHPEEATELEPILRLAVKVREARAVEPRPDAKAATRYRVLTYAKERPRSLLTWVTPLLGLPRVAALVAISALLLVLAPSSVLVASASALPGDPWYPVKEVWENVQLAFAFDKEGKAITYAQLALRRTEELAELSNRGRAVPPEAVRVLTTHTEAAVAGMETGGDTSSLTERLLELTQRQQQVLTNVAAKAPETAQPALQHALEVSQRGHLRAQEAIEEAREGKEPPGKQRDATTPEPSERQRRRAVTTDSTPTSPPVSAPHREDDDDSDKKDTSKGGRSSQEGAPSTATPEPSEEEKAKDVDNHGKKETPERDRGRPTATPTPTPSTQDREPTPRPSERGQHGGDEDNEARATPTPRASSESTLGHRERGRQDRDDDDEPRVTPTPGASSEPTPHPGQRGPREEEPGHGG